jgi:aspartyl-tRNA(Asn)/glutamyl-tRNA(Gln) amidotransferase subunit A
MTNNELHNLTLAEASELIRTKTISPVDLTISYLQRIELLDPQVQAWVTVIHEEAIDTAKKLEEKMMKGDYLGPLHGIPYGAKDIFYTANIRTSAGSKVHPDFVPSENATVINKLQSSGAVLLGKTTTTEYAFRGGEPKTRNPWNLDHTPGGSSTGSAAAMAASMASFTLGTQTVGSMLRPAAFNSLTCLKSTYGRVSRYGVIPSSWSLDHVGAFTRTVEDTAIVLEAIAGYDWRDPSSLATDVPRYTAALEKRIKGTVIGIPTSFFHAKEQIITTAVENAIKVFEEHGVQFKWIDMPSCWKEAQASHEIVRRVEAASYHQEKFEEVPERFGPFIREQLEIGNLTSAVDYLRAQRIRTVFINEMMRLFDEVDAIVTPSSLTLPPMGLSTGDPIFNAPFSNAGLPSMSIPVGFDSATGLPIGMQLAAPLLNENLLISLGHQYQKVTDWHIKRPQIAVSRSGS